MNVIQEILTFWFGEKSSPDYGEYKNFWFQSTPEDDAEIRKRFHCIYKKALNDELSSFLDTPEGALALILLLDQFPRNMFRGTPQAFASDAKALEVVKFALSKGFDKKLSPMQRLFFYLPFQHSEALEDQERALILYADLDQQDASDYAQQHYDIIKRFGRFPHRNAILGRDSTPDELSYLAHPQSQNFGQK